MVQYAKILCRFVVVGTQNKMTPVERENDEIRHRSVCFPQIIPQLPTSPGSTNRGARVRCTTKNTPTPGAASYFSRPVLKSIFKPRLRTHVHKRPFFQHLVRRPRNAFLHLVAVCSRVRDGRLDFLPPGTVRHDIFAKAQTCLWAIYANFGRGSGPTCRAGVLTAV